MIVANLKKSVTANMVANNKAVNYKLTSGYNHNNKGCVDEAFTSLRAFATALNNSSKGSTFILGTGTTAPQESDYCLENRVTTFTIGSVSRDFTDTTGAMTLSAICTWTGTESAISEIGLVGGYDNSNYLLAREVLETPITVNNGDTFTVSMVIG